jgi:hypothetical protein
MKPEPLTGRSREVYAEAIDDLGETVFGKPSAARGPQIFYETEGCVLAGWQNLLIAIWTTQGTGPLAQKLGELSKPFSKAHPEGFSNVHIIGKKPPLPTGEARDKFLALMDEFSGNVACIGTVLEGSGFWASAVRSFIVGLRLLAPRTFEMQTYATVAELIGWIVEPHATRTGVRFDPVELEQVLATLRARLPA